MSDATCGFLSTLSQNFMRGRLDAVVEHFVFPIPLYAGDSLQVFGAPCTFKEVLTMYRDATLHAGITQLVPRILANGLPVNGYSNVWVEWDHHDADGTCLKTSQVHYVFFHAAAAQLPKIEMIEYTELAFPEVPASFSMAKIA
ncbi:MAG: hypothetical protein ABJ263_03665 [Tateyamaria sp.]|uniref:hypothetical protein n=1 Tax=Tateyamaria sp. TaxID=1929288 RepID=UPI003284DF20